MDLFDMLKSFVGNANAARGFDRVAPAGGTATALLNLELRSRVGWPSGRLGAASG